MIQGFAERREYDYIRHGTKVLFGALTINDGRIFAKCSEKRANEDFIAFIISILKNTPNKNRYHFVVDNLNTHMSAALVRLVAWHSNFSDELGIEGKQGILKDKERRKNFLPDFNHEVQRWPHNSKNYLILNDMSLKKCTILKNMGPSQIIKNRFPCGETNMNIPPPSERRCKNTERRGDIRFQRRQIILCIQITNGKHWKKNDYPLLYT